MPTLANAYVATSPTAPLEPGTIELCDPGEFEVRIAIKFAGNLPLGHPHRPLRLGAGELPVVVGHEEQYCRTGAISTYNSVCRDGRPTNRGGYSTSIVVDEKLCSADS